MPSMQLGQPLAERQASPQTAEAEPNDVFRDWPVLVLGIAIFIGIAVYFRSVGFDVIRSDAKHYLKWSHAVWVVETGTHFPTYPLVLWATRGLSFGLLQGAVLLQTVTLTAWVGGVLVVGQILQQVAPHARRTGVALYALFPFVGVVYAVYPVGDAFFGLVLAGALLAFFKRAWLPFTLCVAVGLVCHKAIWMPLGLLSVYAWLRLGYPLRNLLLSPLLLLCWYAYGYTVRSGFWMFEHHVHTHFTPNKLPIFDGILTPALAGGIKPLLKASLLIGLTLIAGWLTYFNARRKQYVWLALTLPPLVMAIMLNPSVVWALARFAKPMAIPLAIALFSFPIVARLLDNRVVHAAVLFALTLTQIAAAVYIDQVYFG